MTTMRGESGVGPLLICAPTGRDATIIESTLSVRGLDAHAVGSLEEACRFLQLDDGLQVGGLIATEEALADGAEPLAKCLAAQASWSDLPTCVLTVPGSKVSPVQRWRFFEALGNVTLLARPLTTEGLVSAARGLRRARARQLDTKRYLDELNSVAETLERRVNQRTQELMAAEATLRQAQKMEAIGQLTGGLAHDFNNLLQVINANMELIRVRVRQGRVDDLARYADGARDATQRAAALTHRLLAFSRRQTLDPKPVDVNQLISEMVELITRTLGPSISISTQLADQARVTMCDPSQLENAVLNLCINARDAMPSGGSLRIATSVLELPSRNPFAGDLPPGSYIVLAVTDSGCGMTADVAARAFEPFFTTRQRGQGTGLGLSMVYGFASQSGGRAVIESSPDLGTTVSVLLPRLQLALPPTVDSGPHTPPLRPKTAKTVVVVDDEDGVRALSAEVLREAGYTVMEAQDGPSGLSLLESIGHVDMLVTDIGMPGMNGREMAQLARRARPRLNVLYITGYAEKAAFPTGNIDPGSHLLTKPFAIHELVARVDEILAA